MVGQDTRTAPVIRREEGGGRGGRGGDGKEGEIDGLFELCSASSNKWSN